MSKYQALIDALDAPGLTDCQWEACGPSFGAPRPVYLNEVVAASDDEDDDGPLETVCRAPLGSKDECTADTTYIAEANPSTIRALLADLERAEKALKDVQAAIYWDDAGQYRLTHSFDESAIDDALAQMAGG